MIQQQQKKIYIHETYCVIESCIIQQQQQQQQETEKNKFRESKQMKNS